MRLRSSTTLKLDSGGTGMAFGPEVTQAVNVQIRKYQERLLEHRKTLTSASLDSSR